MRVGLSIALLLVSAVCRGEVPAAIVDQQDAVVRVVSQYTGRNSGPAGSGSYVGGNYVVSAAHLIYDYNTRRWEDIAKTVVQFRNGESIRAAPCWYDVSQDLILFALDREPNGVKPIRFVPLRRDPVTTYLVTMPVIGETVYWLGYGSSGGFMCGSGRVEYYDDNLETWIIPNRRIMTVDGPARDGDSGCPVFNVKGEQVAVLHRVRLEGGQRTKMLATSIATIYEAFAPIKPVRAGAVWIDGQVVDVQPVQSCGPGGCVPGGGGLIGGGAGIRGPFGGGIGGGFQIGGNSRPPNGPPPNYQPVPPSSRPPFIEQPKPEPEPEQPQPPLPPLSPPEPEDVPYLWIWAVLAFVICGLVAGGTYYAQLD